MSYPDKANSNGLWLKSYTIGGQNRKTRAGSLWSDLVYRTEGKSNWRCYDKTENGFKSFQEFAEWCQTQEGYLKIDNHGYYWQLDKDILKPGNTVYSPDFCTFVPTKVNSLLIEQPSKQGLPKGVTRNLKNSTKYVARCRDLDGKRVHCGVFETPEQAHIAYTKQKRLVMEKVLKEYDKILPMRVLDAIKTNWNL